MNLTTVSYSVDEIGGQAAKLSSSAYVICHFTDFFVKLLK